MAGMAHNPELPPRTSYGERSNLIPSSQHHRLPPLPDTPFVDRGSRTPKGSSKYFDKISRAFSSTNLRLDEALLDIEDDDEDEEEDAEEGFYNMRGPFGGKELTRTPHARADLAGPIRSLKDEDEEEDVVLGGHGHGASPEMKKDTAVFGGRGLSRTPDARAQYNHSSSVESEDGFVQGVDSDSPRVDKVERNGDKAVFGGRGLARTPHARSYTGNSHTGNSRSMDADVRLGDELEPVAPRDDAFKTEDDKAVFGGRGLARTPHARANLNANIAGDLDTEDGSPPKRPSDAETDRKHRIEGEAGVKRSISTRGLDDYPVLSTRQGGMNTARSFSPTKAGFALPLAVTTSTTPAPSSPRKRSTDLDPFVNHVEDDILSHSVNPATIPLPETPARPTSSRLPDTNATSYTATSSASRATSASFLFPFGADGGMDAADASMIGNCRPPTSLGMGMDEDSFDFDIEHIRPLTGRKARLGRVEGDMARQEGMWESPAKVGGTVVSSDTSGLLAVPTHHRLDQSTLLPSSPRIDVDLLASTNAISRVNPPWADSATASTSSTDTITELAVAPSRRSPRKTPRSASKTKRTFPASSSDKSLATVGEDDFLQVPSAALDRSTLLPVSPAKQAHLLWREHLLMNENMSLVADDEGHTMYLPQRPQTTARSLATVREDNFLQVPSASALDRSTILPVSPAKQAHLLGKEHQLLDEDMSLVADDEGNTIYIPQRTNFDGPGPSESLSRTPKKRDSPMKVRTDRDQVWNQTLDLKDLMAKMKKPKRASGTEESFVDLLNGDHQPEGLDEFDADETFLPASLRPQRDGNSQPGIIAQFRKSRSSHFFPSAESPVRSTLPPDSPRKSRRRSKSLSEAEPKPLAFDIPLTKRKTPAKMAPPPVPTAARQRLGMAPCGPSTASRRISLSAGALPMPSSASVKKLDLPGTKVASTRSSVVQPRQSIAPVTRSAVPTAALTSMAPPAARPSMAPPSGRSSMAPPAPRARASVLPSTGTSGVPARPRIGSTLPSATTITRTSFQPRSRTISGTVTTSASQPTLAPSLRPVASSRTIEKPSMPASRSAVTGTASGLTRPTVRSAGLPQPARDGSARSAVSRPSIAPTATSREFGTEAGRTVNRLSRPTGSSSTAPTAKVSLTRQGLPASKLSAGPVASPSKREAMGGISAKSRALSTPASALTRASTTTVRPAMPALPVRKASVPAERVSGLPRTTATSGSRLPTAGSASASGIARTATGLPSRSAGSTGAGVASRPGGSGRAIADIRAKLTLLEQRTRTVGRR